MLAFVSFEQSRALVLQVALHQFLIGQSDQFVHISNRLLIQVVSQLKPERCGVSDQALYLARELRDEFGIDSTFIVLNSTLQSTVPFRTVFCSPSQLLETCFSLTNSKPGAILVHCSGYGYSSDGAPIQLADALESVRSSGQFRIGTYFHELFASAMPWKSAFWHARRQKEAVRRIANQSELVSTNLSHHSDWLKRNARPRGLTPIQTLPVFSNVGERSTLPAMDARRSVLAVFGLPGTRSNSYNRLSRFKTMLFDLGVDEILDIGPEFDAPVILNSIPVKRLGILAGSEIANILSQSRFGFVPYPPFCLAKSSILASFSALGTIPVLSESFSRPMDGLIDGVHVISPRTAKAAVAYGLERCSEAIWTWYAGHRVHVHASTYARLLFQIPTEAAFVGCEPANVSES
jgi:hypothetical protein